MSERSSQSVSQSVRRPGGTQRWPPVDRDRLAAVCSTTGPRSSQRRCRQLVPNSTCFDSFCCVDSLCDKLRATCLQQQIRNKLRRIERTDDGRYAGPVRRPSDTPILRFRWSTFRQNQPQ